MGCTKSKNKHVPAPWPLASHSRQEWVAWRDSFLTFVNEKYIPNYKQGSLLNDYIGNIGQEIAKNFYFCNFSSETDVNTLLFKFDVYFIFGGRRRHNNESIAEYIIALKNIADKTAKSNTDKVVKEKLLQDLKSENVLVKFNEVIPALSNISDYESLSLTELIFIWEECEKPAENKEKLSKWEVKKRDAFEHIQNNNCCLQCDRNHKGKICPAKGQQCWKCGDFNHFAKCCVREYIVDCANCGSNHIQKKCQAFAKECSRCKKMNHFAWKCFAEVVLSCDFCGHSHINNRQQCPANNSRCHNCNKVGHYSFKCRSRRNSRHRK